MKVVVYTETAGQHFATYGVVRALTARGRRGEVLHTTDEKPYGFTSAAIASAEAWAAKHGHTIIYPEPEFER